MTVTVGSFRSTFVAFADTSKYPNALVDFLITLYSQMVNAERWGDQTDFGIMLAVAHNLAIEGQNVKAAAINGTPGTFVGIANNKSSDKLSVGYDSTTATQAGAGFWNLTNYGTRYYRYAMIFGAGPVQVNTPGASPGPYNGIGWPGPPYTNRY
jgi:hypothetical protein